MFSADILIMSLLMEVNRRMESLVYEIERAVQKVDPNDTLLIYDVDMGGLPTAAAALRYFEEIHGGRPKYHWMTYLHTERAVRYAQDNPSSNVMFLDLEPHSEIDDIAMHAKRVDIFGHHKDRKDIVELSKTDLRVRYFNPRDYSEGLTYERGVPISYPWILALKKQGVDVSLLGSIALRGYGYKRLYEEFAPESMKFRPTQQALDHTIESINLLVSHDLNNATRVVRALAQAETLEDKLIKDLNERCLNQKLGDRRDETIYQAIMDSRVIGDVQIFPIKTPDDLIKAHVSTLDEARRKASTADVPLNTTVCIQYQLKETGKPHNFRKVSIRTERGIDLPSILKRVVCLLSPISSISPALKQF